MTTREQIESEIKQRQEWLAVLDEIESGGVWQWKYADNPTCRWNDVIPPITRRDIEELQFRRKPEPLRGFVNLYEPCTLETLEQAKQAAGASCIGQAEFVQVI